MTIQTSSNLNQEVPKIKLGLQDKYNEESKQEETKESSKAPTKEALNPENIQGVVDRTSRTIWMENISSTIYTKRKN
jgi:hypothetical protein